MSISVKEEQRDGWNRKDGFVNAGRVNVHFLTQEDILLVRFGDVLINIIVAFMLIVKWTLENIEKLLWFYLDP